MKKHLFISTALFCCILSNVRANEVYNHGFTVGYAKTNLSNGINASPKGVNLKYHFMTSDNDLGFIASFSYTRDHNKYYDVQYKARHSLTVNYLSLLVGPSYTFNNIFRVYGLLGVGRISAEESIQNTAYGHAKRTDVAYGGGIQFKIRNFLIDLSIDHVDYNKSIGDVKSDNFNFTIGWEF